MTDIMKTVEDKQGKVVSVHAMMAYRRGGDTDPLILNLLTPNVNYSGRTAPLTSKVPFYIFIKKI